MKSLNNAETRQKGREREKEHDEIGKAKKKDSMSQTHTP